jgi:pyrimidine-nucleoside phosphorylase
VTPGSEPALDVRAFLRAKRDGGAHAPEEIQAFIRACMRREVADDQLGAWLMAAFLRGLDERETDALTGALAGSGRVFDWDDLGRPSADKHSTGGVGDKVSLVVAPLVASCDVLVPMVAGRGLGHTGGTLDKLESIPGFRIRLSPEAMRAQLDAVGVVIVGQGPELAPADGLLYAVRDVTGTVESEPFIVSSIVSKKVAEGARALVYDVKCGNGAFMTTRESAGRLGRRLVQATRAQGRAAAALVTDMSQPLGVAVGNALEVREAVEVLRGAGPADVRSLSVELGIRMLLLSGVEPSAEAARRRLERTLASGAAWERFVALVEAQGGEARALDRADGLPRAPLVVPVPAPRDGWVTAVDAFGLGELSVAIGAGRRSKEQAVDPRVGLEIHARSGERVAQGQPLAHLHLASERPEASRRAASCFTLGESPVAAATLVLERIE